MEEKLKNLEHKVHLHGEELEECKTEVGQQIEAANLRLQDVEEKVDTVIEVLSTINSGVKFFVYAGKVIRWVGLTVTAIVATYVALKDYLS